MPDYDWNKIRLEYITDGTTSYRKLSRKYGPSLSTLKQIARREKWVEERTRHKTETATKFEEVIVSESIDAARAIAAAREVLATRALAVASHTTDPDDLHKLASTLQILSKMMGLQPDLDEKEQKARIASIEARSQIQEEEDGAGVIVIVGKDEDDEDE